MATNLPLDLDLVTVFSTLTLAYFTYSIVVVIQRLFFSPLAKFPGSRLAAATSWYEFYFDWWLQGKYVFEIEKMHKKYGQCIQCSVTLSLLSPQFFSLPPSNDS